ncbi:hypothetical protein [Kitasatospora sp. NPDC001175]|uniref:hypothetical protein n=1 Tax=Kitasatospora sp. NPDC001175 TaxID=3157103 RepID=UPI003D046A41
MSCPIALPRGCPLIAHLRRVKDTTDLLAHLYGPDERGTHSNPRLVGGDCHGAPIEMLAATGAMPYLAQAPDAPLERLGDGCHGVLPAVVTSVS